MSSFLGLAEQVLGGGGSSGQQVHKTGGHEFNAPHNVNNRQPRYDTEAVLSHADGADEGYIRNAVQHVHDNPDQHHEEVSEGDLSTYGPMIMSAISSLASKQGIDAGSFLSSGLGAGGGNQLMGVVMKQAGSFIGGGGGGGGGDKQSMMNGAAMTLTKLVAQNQLSAFIGGSNSGGLGMLDVGKTLLKSRFG